MVADYTLQIGAGCGLESMSLSWCVRGSVGVVYREAEAGGGVNV